MSENEDHFVPRSDEELARLLEAQLSALRGQTAEQPRVDVAVEITAEDTSLDEIFGALLEDTTNPIDIPAVAPSAQAVVIPEPEYVTATFVEPDETQPITFVTEAIVETAAVVHFVEDDAVIEQVVVATTIAETATSTPVPSMFGEAEYIAAVLETPMSSVESVVEVIPEAVIEEKFVPTTNPIANFAPRPSFDELVFGVSSDE
ncbi:MAG: hypothetical protein RIR88_872 [Actinomycetota bacterium]